MENAKDDFNKQQEDKPHEPEHQNFASKVSDYVTDWAGTERLKGFSLGDVFSEALKRHTAEEVEDYFTVGTHTTTPPIEKVETGWPRPWMFLRTFLGAAFVYFIFVQAWKEYENINLVPGLIIVGSFAVPLSALIFFFEMNVRHNVSLYQIIRLVFLGGIVSMTLSMMFFQIGDSLALDWLGASMAGIVEEPGKLLALAIVVNTRRYHYTLNGLLFGAAVGTGFAAFESAGYAFYAGLYNADDMLDSIMQRGMLAPFGHIVWTAMCAGALWKVKAQRAFSFKMLADQRFYRVFLMAVLMHMIWNSPIYLPFYLKYFALGAAAWVVVFSLIQGGLRQIQEEKARLTGG
ncbi:MAG: PrsW family intramembrane metalloprotease [Saprospiraceae bacterium]|nr:PrsW family intramembrane metalloprotease [Saprospiraceae bacterium]